MSSVKYLHSYGGHASPIVAITSLISIDPTKLSQALPPRPILTASECGELRAWSISDPSSLQHSKILYCFHNGISSLALAENPCILYIASENQVFALDLKLNQWKESDIALIYEAEDDVNQLDVHWNEKYLSITDDAGNVAIVDIGTKKTFKKCRAVHENIVLCGRFVPRRPWELVTGGMDNLMVRWDFSKGVPIQVFHLQGEEDENSTKTINPPFIHSLCTSTKSGSIACGCGDGTVRLFEVPKDRTSRPNKKNPLWEQLKVDAQHNYNVVMTQFFCKNSREFLVSVATNRSICIHERRERNWISIYSAHLFEDDITGFIKKINCGAIIEDGGEVYLLIGNIGDNEGKNCNVEVYSISLS